MDRYNPNSSRLIVLSVYAGSGGVQYLFPLNPSSLTINQQNRVSSTFTYAGKVFQNLGAGLKTISIEGHTGYKLDLGKYGLQSGSSDLSIAATHSLEKQTGGRHWLDLYSIIQLVKGENKYLSGVVDEIDQFYSIDNIDKIFSVKLTLPDQGITYDVILQNDSFMRNREQPNLYKYKLDFIVIDEYIGSSLAISPEKDFIPPPEGILSEINDLAKDLKNVKSFFMSLPGVQTASDLYNNGLSYVEKAIRAGNFFITSANSAISDLRRLERMTDALNKITLNLSLVRGVVNQIKTFDDLKTAFYEPYIRFKNIDAQLSLLEKSMTGSINKLSFDVSLTRLASISAPVTLAANKATVAQFQKDVRQLNQITFPFPVDYVREVIDGDETKIVVYFKQSPSSLNVENVSVFAYGDFGRENNLVEDLNDTSMTLSTSYSETGYVYDFIIDYNYETFETITKPKYKSLKRVIINNGDTIDSLIRHYAKNESRESKSYISEVAYLNNIEYPYVVTEDDPVFEAYLGSYGYKIFSSNGEFTQYIYNINIVDTPGINMTLFDSSIADETQFLIQQPEVIEQIKTSNKFFVIIMKETYSSRCYALFGMTDSESCSMFAADSYVLCALDKGRSYDINTNTLFEILSPYTITSDLIDYYGQSDLFDAQTSDDLYEVESIVINAIYEQNIGSFASNAFPFLNYDSTAEDLDAEAARFDAQKIFLSGDANNNGYAILTNFVAVGGTTESDYSIAAYTQYRILTNGQEILLPSFEDSFIPFADVYAKEDTYKIDLDARFEYLDDQHISILPGYDDVAGVLDFKLVNGIENVRQAIKNRLECPQGGLILHMDYGMPDLLGKKNTAENLILFRYNLFQQLVSDNRIRSVNNMKVSSKADAIIAEANAVLVNNDEIRVNTTF
jgi:hypothetical protein